MHNFSLKQFFGIIIVVVFPMFVMAQSAMQDVIYLKDGSILRGEIVGHADKESVKIEVTGLNVLVVQRDNIEKITREPEPQTSLYKKYGYVNMTGLTFAPRELGNSVQFHMINGYQINPNLAVGIGFGYTTYEEPLDAIPLFLGLKYKILKANNTPFAFLRAGYNFSVKSNIDQSNRQNIPIKKRSGGGMLNTGVGLHFDVSENLAWYFTVGYLADNLSYTEQFGIQEVETNLEFRRISLAFGLSF
jgi:hypothetical protein